MPNIELVPVPSYQPTDPYHHIVDNLPIGGLIERDDLVNAQVDVITTMLNDAIGTQGSLANRLNQSLNPDGTIKTVAIDNALHSIAEHLDASGYVRMTLAERDKLSFIADEATKFAVTVNTISGAISYTNQTITLQNSDSIAWRVSGSSVFADTNFPSSVRHGHYYGLTPVPVNILNPNYINYYVTNAATPYRQGSLRVYVNGVRLNTNSPVYVPTGFPTVSWIQLLYSEAAATNGIVTSGLFAFSTAIPTTANVVVDFDVQFS